jgi:hypothetical protein
MSKIALSGNASGTGTLTIAAPNTNSDATINLPTVTGGAFVVSDASGNVGIGTDSPTGRLELKSASATQVFRTDESTSTYTYTQGLDDTSVYFQSSSNSRGFRWISGLTPTERMRLTQSGLLQFNSGYGSVATAYGCRAWVNFDGTGTVAIRASGNVSSITDGGTGTYTVNFSTAMPDVNYAAVASAGNDAASDRVTSTGQATYSTTACGIRTATTSSVASDAAIVSFAAFR